MRRHVVAARMRSLPWLARFSLTAGGLGYMPLASGTWGSLPPCLLVLLLLCSGQPVWMTQVILALLALWGAVSCIRFGTAAEQAVGVKDPGCVVADEVAGMCIALAGMSWCELGGTGCGEASCAAECTAEGCRIAWQVAGAFLLFRVFDVIKPPPCGTLQRVRGGWGILLDDLLAGVYAAVCLRLVLAFV